MLLELLRQISGYVTLPILILYGIITGWIFIRVIKLKNEVIIANKEQLAIQKERLEQLKDERDGIIKLKDEHINLLKDQLTHLDYERKDQNVQLEIISQLNSDKLEIVRKEFEQALDITKKKEVEMNELQNIKTKYYNLIDEFQRREELSSQMIVAVTHELRLILQTILINAENLKDEIYEKDADINFIKQASVRISFETFKLNMYLSNIERIVRSPSEREKKYEFKKESIFPLLAQAAERFRTEAENKGVVIEMPSYVFGKFPELPVVEEELQVALNNIYSNAVKFSFSSKTGDGKKNRIITECHDINIGDTKYFVINITDFGIGILKEEIDSGNIFKIGYRGRSSRDRNRTGGGVGLYLVKEIVERIHGGRVEITSEQGEDVYRTSIKIMLPYQRVI